MDFIQQQSRHQISMHCSEDHIHADNPVWVMDAFVQKLDLVKLGFRARVLQQEGRPAFESKVLLKLYLYGYFDSVYPKY